MPAEWTGVPDGSNAELLDEFRTWCPLLLWLQTARRAQPPRKFRHHVDRDVRLLLTIL